MPVTQRLPAGDVKNFFVSWRETPDEEEDERQPFIPFELPPAPTGLTAGSGRIIWGIQILEAEGVQKLKSKSKSKVQIRPFDGLLGRPSDGRPQGAEWSRMEYGPRAGQGVFVYRLLTDADLTMNQYD
jgi:hypothetical protein